MLPMERQSDGDRELRLIDCVPDETGQRCVRCGWDKRGRHTFPRRTCRPPSTPAIDAPVGARMTAALLAEIDAAIAAGEIAPWSQLGRDHQTVEALLAAHCQSCPELSAAGCERVPWPCKRWAIWRQTVILGSCPRFAGEADA